MDKLKLKIKNTTLFDDEDKVNILTALETFSVSELKELESVVDEFDAKYLGIVSEYQSKVLAELDGIVADATPEDKDRLTKAAGLIKSGLNDVLSGQPAE